jgi:hypothetical protein
MKLLVLPVILLFALSACGQQKPSVEAQSSGDCSPNILSNQGEVQFTCNTSMDEATAKKIVSLLNQIIKKENSGTTAGSEKEINQKLDEILNFLRNQSRHLGDDQKEKLASLLKVAPQDFYFVSAPDAETTHFGNDILGVLHSAGWNFVMHPPNWGTIEHQGQGLFIQVADENNPPRGAIVLQRALQQVGVDATIQTFVMVPIGKFGIYLGVNPARDR